MYYFFMKRENLKKILQEYSESSSTITSWMNGNRRPTYEILYELNTNFKIPFSAWKDIKSLYY